MKEEPPNLFSNVNARVSTQGHETLGRVSVSSQDNKKLGINLLEYAKKGDWAKIRALLDKAPEILKDKSTGNTVWHYAVGDRQIEILQKLTENKFPGIAIKNNEGNTSLHYAVLYDAPLDIIHALLASPIHSGIFSNNNKFETPLYTAVNKQNPNLKIVTLLCEAIKKQKKRIDVVCRERTSGNTPLHVAANKRNVELIQILVSYGCDHHYPNNQDQTPYTIINSKNIPPYEKQDLFNSLGCKNDPYKGQQFWQTSDFTEHNHQEVQSEISQTIKKD